MPILNEWKILPRQSEQGLSLIWGPDRKTLVTGSFARGNIEIWDVLAGKVIYEVSERKIFLDLLALSPDGAILATASSGDMNEPIRFLDLATRRSWHTLTTQEDHSSQISFSPRGNILASAAENIKLWNVKTGTEVRTLNGVRSLAFDPTGGTLATISQETPLKDNYRPIRIYNSVTGEVEKTLSGNSPYLHQVAFSHDGLKLASLGRGNDRHADSTSSDLITIWNLATSEEFSSWHAGHEIKTILFRPLGKELASVGYALNSRPRDGMGIITLWDFSTGRILEAVEAELNTDIAFSPDGKLLAGGSYDGTIKLWEVNS